MSCFHPHLKIGIALVNSGKLKPGYRGCQPMYHFIPVLVQVFKCHTCGKSWSIRHA